MSLNWMSMEEVLSLRAENEALRARVDALGQREALLERELEHQRQTILAYQHAYNNQQASVAAQQASYNINSNNKAPATQLQPAAAATSTAKRGRETAAAAIRSATAPPQKTQKTNAAIAAAAAAAEATRFQQQAQSRGNSAAAVSVATFRSPVVLASNSTSAAAAGDDDDEDGDEDDDEEEEDDDEEEDEEQDDDGDDNNNDYVAPAFASSISSMSTPGSKLGASSFQGFSPSGNNSSSSSNRTFKRFDEEMDQRLLQAVGHFGSKWQDVAEFVGNGVNSAQVAHRWRHYVDPNRKQSQGDWSGEQEKKLIDYCNRYQGAGRRGGIDWSAAELFVGRGVMDCRARWKKIQDVGKKRGSWTAEEDAVIKRMVAEWEATHDPKDVMRKWKSIGDVLGRSGAGCHMRYNYFCSIGENAAPRQQQRKAPSSSTTSAEENLPYLSGQFTSDEDLIILKMVADLKSSDSSSAVWKIIAVTLQRPARAVKTQYEYLIARKMRLRLLEQREQREKEKEKEKGEQQPLQQPQEQPQEQPQQSSS